MPIARVPIDVVIGRERTQRSQVVKQADVVALIALLPEEFPGAMAETNFRHYEPRCAHGSSLSAGMHALVAARLGDADMALRYLRETAAADLDLDPNSAGGVRIAGLGALWQAVVLGFAGLDLTGDTLGIDPRLPPAVAQPVLPRVLERPVRGDPDRGRDRPGYAGGGRRDGAAHRPDAAQASGRYAAGGRPAAGRRRIATPVAVDRSRLGLKAASPRGGLSPRHAILPGDGHQGRETVVWRRAAIFTASMA